MGSSLPTTHVHWVILATLCGILFLLFDAVRYFVQQLGTVRLRWLSGDPQEDKRSGWRRYDAETFQLVSGALLQVALIVAVVSTAMIFDDLTIARATFTAAVLWTGIVLLLKFVLALIPDDAAEIAVQVLIPIAHLFYYLFWPVLFPLRRLIERMDRETQADHADEDVTDAEVQAYIDVGEEEGILEESEGKLLQQIVDFGDRVARELMTPRIDVLAFHTKWPIEELAKMFSESKYSRIPIYDESIDRITGIVHIKEMFDAVLRKETKSVAELARPPYFVSETKKVSELLKEFQSEHLQVAVVVDEYGGTAGLITIEDVIEEIVGEIADEHEDEELTMADVGNGTFLVSGLVRVADLEETLGAQLASHDYETVAGLIFTTLGRVPRVGTVVTKNGWRFDVDRADRRRIYRVKVSRDPAWRSEEEEEEDARS